MGTKEEREQRLKKVKEEIESFENDFQNIMKELKEKTGDLNKNDK